MGRYVVRTEKFDRFRLHLASSNAEQGWLDAVDGSRTLRGLAALNAANQREFLAFISVLRAADMIDFLDDPRITAERSPSKRPLTEFADALPISVSPSGSLEDDAELESRIEEITARLSDGITYAQLLDVEEDADELEVHRAYRGFVEDLNGESFDRLRPGLQGRVLPLLRAARDACNNLSDPASREYFQDRRVVLAEGVVTRDEMGIPRRASMTKETIPVSSRVQTREGAEDLSISGKD